MSARSRPLRFLRSRRLVVGLFLGIGVYSIAATFLPDVFSFGNPLFLAAATVFTASTAVCAQERMRGAVALLRGWREPSSAVVDRIAAAPGRSVELPSGMREAEALALAKTALRDLGMRCARRDDGVWAHRNAWGALGSPVFHYALAGLFLFAGLGQAMKWEGIIGVMEGGSAEDVPARYESYEAGRFSSHPTGRVIAVDDLDIEHVYRDVARGPAPYVRLFVDGEEVRSQRVFPNSPLRYGSLHVHQLEYGIGVVLSVLGPEGETRGSAPGVFDFDELRPDGTLAIDAVAEALPPGGGSAEEYDVSITLSLDEEGGRFFRRVPERPVFTLSFPSAGGAGASPASVTATPGERIALPDDAGWLVIDAVAHQVWLFVVDDWTIPFIYLFLTVACIGATVALTVPPRAAFVRYEAGTSDVPDAEGAPVTGAVAPDAGAAVPARLVLVTRSRRIDPGFGRSVHRAVETALAEERREA